MNKTIINVIGSIAIFFLLYMIANSIFHSHNKDMIIEENAIVIAELEKTIEDSKKEVIDTIIEAKEEIKLSIAELRQINYGVASKVEFHYKELPSLEGYDFTDKGMTETIKNVIKSMPNLKTDDNIILLGKETIQIESRMGSYNMLPASKKGDYGIAQIRANTAQETLWWLKQIGREDVLEALQKLTDVKLKYNTKVADKYLIEELKYNIPLSLAMMYEYYWRRNPNFQNEISTIDLRAKLWKKEYNSSLGDGTVEAYIKAQGG